jgi:8-oxo-dGTP diphosphatase
MRFDESTVPTFGERAPGQAYISRPGAYALIPDDAGRIAVVLTHGRCYLPGGGVEPGETLEATLHREVLEECGLRVDRLTYLGAADEYVYADDEDRYYQKRCTFFAATARPAPDGQPEPGTDLLWLTTDEAEARLAHASHCWAVRRFLTGTAPRRFGC